MRQIIELLQKNLSDREISTVLGVSRNSVARIRQASDDYNGDWEEYCEKCKKEGAKACSYPIFARGYKRYTVSKNYTSHVEHKPGVTLEVDWSGPTMNYIDPDKNTRS